MYWDGVLAGTSCFSPARVYRVKTGGYGMATVRAISGGFMARVASGMGADSGKVLAAVVAGTAGAAGHTVVHKVGNVLSSPDRMGFLGSGRHSEGAIATIAGPFIILQFSSRQDFSQHGQERTTSFQQPM